MRPNLMKSVRLLTVCAAIASSTGQAFADPSSKAYDNADSNAPFLDGDKGNNGNNGDKGNKADIGKEQDRAP